jgi:hypothetical protein
MTAGTAARPTAQASTYVQDLIARAPRPTDEQARALVVLFQRGVARANTRSATEAAAS